MKKLAFALLFGCFLAKMAAQDIHFTQFYASPLTLNPALAGAIEGKYRVGLVHRNQWRRSLDEPFRTVGLSSDLRLRPPFNKRSNYKDQIGIGMHFFNDRVAVIDFSTTQIGLSAAYHKALDLASKQFLSLGIQGSLIQRNVSYEALTFFDQFNGIDGYTLSSFETLPENNFSFSDMAVGLNYSGQYDNDFGLFAGVGYFHFLAPNVSFYQKDDDPNKLFPKWSGHVALQIPVANRVAVLPRALFALQGPHLEVNAGANLRFKMGEYGGSAFHVGSWARPVKNENGFGLDAVVLMAGLEKGGVLIGASYDLHLATASRFGQRRSAFELTLQYLGNYDSDEILCPKF